MKKTRWFPASVKPVRTGEYQVRSDDCRKQRCSDPHRLRFYALSGDWCTDWGDIANTPGFEWRGLAEDPQQAQEAAR